MHARIQLRWSDMDAQRHVNNARIADYLQEARVHLLHGSGLLDQGVVVVNQQVMYRRSIEYSSEPLDVELAITELGAARVQVGYVLRQFDEVVAEARTLLAPFDFDDQRPVRLSGAMRQHFEQHLEEWEPFSTLDAPALDGRGTQTRHHIRWTDLDRYGHVNNMLVFEYLQQARIEVSPQWSPTLERPGAREAEYYWLVARQDVEYVAQIHHSFEPLVVTTALTRLGRTSLTSAAELHSAEGELVGRGRTVIVCTDSEFRPCELPDRAGLERHLICES